MEDIKLIVSDTDAFNEEEREYFESFFQTLAQLVAKYGKSILENTDHTA